MRRQGGMILGLSSLIIFVSLPGAAVAAVAEGDELSKAIAQVRRSTEKYTDVNAATRDGYRQVTPMIRIHGYHYFNPTVTEFSLTRPQILLHVKQGNEWQLVGVEYVTVDSTPPTFFPAATWHPHEASCHYADGTEKAAGAAALCPKTHPRTGAEFISWHPNLQYLHVWAWYPNPSGMFAETNPLLAPFGGVQEVADEEDGRAGGHDHGGFPTPEEAAPSEFAHRFNGAFILPLAFFALAELALPGRHWIRLGWPLVAIAWGLQPVFERFLRGPLVAVIWGVPYFTPSRNWFHLSLHFIVLTLGLIELLRRASLLQHRAWGYFFPALAIVAGVPLALHHIVANGHLWTFIVQQLYWGSTLFKVPLQHLAIGIVAILIGVTKFLWDRQDADTRFRRSIWRVFMVALGLLYLFYTEI